MRTATLLALAVLAAGASAQDASFTAGSLLVSGSASDPTGGSDSATAAGVVQTFALSADGSTSSGLVGAEFSMTGSITESNVTTISLLGAGQASQPAGYGGDASLTLSTRDLNQDDDPLVLTVSGAAVEYTYAIFDNNSANTFVDLQPVTGAFLPGNRLTPGDYALSINSNVFVSGGDTVNPATLDWTLTLTRVPAPTSLALGAVALAATTRRRR